MDVEQSEWLESLTFDEIAIGDVAALSHTLSLDDIALFAAASGDVNPVHLDAEFARGTRFGEVIAHGMWGGALISSLLGTRLPGPGTIYVSQSLDFHRPVKVGDCLEVSVTVAEKCAETRRVMFDCRCVNQHGETVISGRAQVVPSREKVRCLRPRLPSVAVVREDAPGGR